MRREVGSAHALGQNKSSIRSIASRSFLERNLQHIYLIGEVEFQKMKVADRKEDRTVSGFITGEFY